MSKSATGVMLSAVTAMDPLTITALNAIALSSLSKLFRDALLWKVALKATMKIGKKSVNLATNFV